MSRLVFGGGFARGANRVLVFGLQAALLQGCVQVGPQDLPRQFAQMECPAPPDIPPLPATAHIAIEPGRPAAADAGGRALIGAYIAQREWVRVCRR